MDKSSVLATIDRALDAAGLTRHGGDAAGGIRSTIDQALRAAGLMTGETARAASTAAGGDVIDVVAKEVVADDALDDEVVDEVVDDVVDHGRFTTHLHASAHGSRTYKLFAPSSYDGATSMPLILMLHGCKQNPDDFAAGTRMNELAEQHGFIVAYPAQSVRANGNACWNWFDAAQQRRGGEELSLLAGIVDEVARSHAVDRAKVFVAGLSAGAAMAVLLAREYPDKVAAVAAHSGLPAGAAHDVPSAFAAMQGRFVEPARAGATPAVRTFVIHGDADATVHALNGVAVVAQAVSAFERKGTPLQRAVQPRETGRSGTSCTVTRFTAATGDIAVEEWVLHGAGHAWSGGSAQGSYTAPAGPDASAAMVNFFVNASRAS